MELKGCIFDLDGVLVDTAKYHYLAWKRLAKELGFEFSEKQNEALKGVSRMASLEILLKAGGINKSREQKELLATRKNNWYVEYISKMTPEEILPGSITLLKDLKANGILLAIGSASKNTNTILGHTGLHIFFEAIIDGNKVTHAKPDPEVFLKAAEELMIKPSECIVFEDAVAGVKAALIAGMKCVGIGDKKILSDAHIVVAGLNAITLEQLITLYN